MALFCCMRGCSNGTTPDPKAKFFPFPSVRYNAEGDVEELTRRRRLAWVCAVDKPSITFEHVSPLTYVCSRHFHKGQPAYETSENDPDWLPSLHLGHPATITAEKMAEISQSPPQTPTTSNITETETLMSVQQTASTSKITDNGVKKPKEQTSRIADVSPQKSKKQTTTALRSLKAGFFVQHECCVANCDGKSHNSRGQRVRNGLTFHAFPVWRKSDGVFLSDLTRRRREAWVKAVSRGDITFEDVPEAAQVCSRHFIHGKPAHDMMEADPDWVPSLYLGRKRQKETIKTPSIKSPAPAREKSLKRKGQKKVPGKAKPKSVPWKELKSRLMGLMNDAEPHSETPPIVAIVDENNLSFEDFFRNAMKTSLDACLDSASQAPAESRPSLDLGWFSVPERSSVSLSRERTSSPSPVPQCENCVRLQERIFQLEERLATPQFIQDPGAFTQWTQPLAPERPSPEKKSSPPKGKFDMEMLARHWFLRYSPKEKVMWCHVCRYYASTGEHGRRSSAFVAGTRTFQNFNIVQHSRSSLHIECVKKFKASKKGGKQKSARKVRA